MMKIDISITASLTAYAMICGFAYLSGYWSVFNIDLKTVLLLASPIDIFKFSIIPAFMAIFISFMIIIIINLNFDSITQNSYEEIVNSNLEKRKSFANRFYLIILLLAIVSFYITYIAKDTGGSYRMVLSATLLMALFITTILNYSIFFMPKTNTVWRIVIILVMVYFPIFTYQSGYSNSRLVIIKQSNVLSVVTDKSCSSNNDETFIFLTFLNDKVLSYSLKDKSICISSYDFIKLKEFKPKNDKK